MNVIVEIDGREALPVRAIPLLTDWKEMSPDAVAKALAGDEHFYYFAGLCAYRIEDGATKPIRATWWQGFAVRNLKALSDRIEADQVTHEAGHQKWRKESLAELPAGVFVWKDEYVPMYESRYGPDEMARILGRELTPSEIQARELDFDPFMSPDQQRLVMEGYEDLSASAAPAQTPATHWPLAADAEQSEPTSPDFEKWRLLWRAVSFDENRAKKAISELVGCVPASTTEIDIRDKKVAMLATELTQIASRKDWLASQMGADAILAVERRFSVEEMAESRQPLGAVEIVERRIAIALTNKEIDALISAGEASTEGADATVPVAAPMVTESVPGGAPMLKQPAQEARILELLTSNGHDPLNLADRPPGGRGAKHEIRAMALLEPALFTKKTFDTAWQRLREDGRLVGGD